LLAVLVGVLALAGLLLALSFRPATSPTVPAGAPDSDTVPTLGTPNVVEQEEGLAPDGPVPITCHKRTYGWARPSLDRMRATTFTVARFRDPIDSSTIYPVLFALYLSHVYYIEMPYAVSAGIEPASMSGISAPATGSEMLGPCAHDLNRPPTDTFSTFWLADYRPVEVSVTGDQAVIRISPDPGTFHTFDIARPAIIDPKSPPNRPIAEPAPLWLIRAVDDSGRLLFEQSRYVNAWEVDPSGRLVFAEMDTHFRVALNVLLDGRDNPGELAVYSGGGPNGPATLEVLDRNGNALATYDLAAASKPWQRLATFTLPPQPVTLRLESTSTESANFLILPAAQELP
jgi:hypothetical protein